MLSHQTLFNSNKVVPHAKQTKASSMLPGTSDISHDIFLRLLGITKVTLSSSKECERIFNKKTVKKKEKKTL